MKNSVINKIDNHNHVIESDEATVLSKIYESGVNMVIWRRQLAPQLRLQAQNFTLNVGFSNFSVKIGTNESFDYLNDILGGDSNTSLLVKDMNQLIEMYCYLFELKGVGIRVKVLGEAMCPRFHVDRLPCRLISTYHGPCTEWLLNDCVDRSKLGHGNKGLTDDKSGVYSIKDCIQALELGDVALLKGELWPGNVGNGLVHRSPAASKSDKRLLFSLDFSN